MAGSRPGNIIAGAWAAMMSIGHKGYKENAKIILSACVSLKKAIRDEVPELKVATLHDSSIVTLIQRPGHVINPIALNDVIKKYHHMYLGTTQNPAGLHISMTMPLA